MAAQLKKLNTLVMKTFEDVENVSELWMDDDVQKQVKSMFTSKRASSGRKSDPDAPKKGKSAYLFFCSEHREEVKASLGSEGGVKQITSELARRWNLLKESKKSSDAKLVEKYKKMAEDDKQRYMDEKAQYTPPEDDGEEEKPKRRGGKKQPKEGPKKGKSAYLYFCQMHRETVKQENPEMKSPQITTELARLWNELKSDESRKDEYDSFVAQAEEDKQRYETEKSAFVETQPSKKSEAKTKGTKSKSSDTPASSKSSTKKSRSDGHVSSRSDGHVSSRSETPASSEKPSRKSSKKSAVVVEETLEEEVAVETPSSRSKSGRSKVDASGSRSEKSSRTESSSTDNGYRAFCHAKRDEFKQQHPNAKSGEITKRLASAWKELSSEDREEWSQVDVSEE